MAKNTICLSHDKDTEAAARFYAEAFPDSVVGTIRHAPGDREGARNHVKIAQRWTRAPRYDA